MRLATLAISAISRNKRTLLVVLLGLSLLAMVQNFSTFVVTNSSFSLQTQGDLSSASATAQNNLGSDSVDAAAEAAEAGLDGNLFLPNSGRLSASSDKLSQLLNGDDAVTHGHSRLLAGADAGGETEVDRKWIPTIDQEASASTRRKQLAATGAATEGELLVSKSDESGDRNEATTKSSSKETTKPSSKETTKQRTLSDSKLPVGTTILDSRAIRLAYKLSRRLIPDPRRRDYFSGDQVIHYLATPHSSSSLAQQQQQHITPAHVFDGVQSKQKPSAEKQKRNTLEVQTHRLPVGPSDSDREIWSLGELIDPTKRAWRVGDREPPASLKATLQNNTIITFAGLHYLKDPQPFFAQIARLLEKADRAILISPEREDMAYDDNLLGDQHDENFGNFYTMPGVAKIYTRDEAVQLVSKAGLVVEAVGYTSPTDIAGDYRSWILVVAGDKAKQAERQINAIELGIQPLKHSFEWTILGDTDRILPPWKDLSLKEAILRVQYLNYSCISTIPSTMDLREQRTFAWKQTENPKNCRMYPFPFIQYMASKSLTEIQLAHEEIRENLEEMLLGSPHLLLLRGFEQSHNILEVYQRAIVRLNEQTEITRISHNPRKADVEKVPGRCKPSARSLKEAPIVIYMSVRNRASNVQRFLDSLAASMLNAQECSVHLAIADFGRNDNMSAVIQKWSSETGMGSTHFNLNHTGKGFPKGVGLDIACRLGASNRHICFSFDADIVVHGDIFTSIREKVQEKKSFFAPIIFSFYKKRPNIVNPSNGWYRDTGFGMIGVYRSDFVRMGGFPMLDRTMWGLEDARFAMELRLAGLKMLRKKMPEIQHYYHGHASWTDSEDGMVDSKGHASDAGQLSSEDLDKDKDVKVVIKYVYVAKGK